MPLQNREHLLKTKNGMTYTKERAFLNNQEPSLSTAVNYIHSQNILRETKEEKNVRTSATIALKDR